MVPTFQYPNLKEAVDKLKLRSAEIAPEHRPLLEKWVEQLEKMNTQMRQLERIERFSNALTEKDKS